MKNQIKEYFKNLNDDNLFLEEIYFFLSIATLPSNDENILYDEIVEEFNLRLRRLYQSNDKNIFKKIDKISLLLENYKSINNNYTIKSKFYEKSNIFFNDYLAKILKENILLSNTQIKVFKNMVSNDNYIFGMPTSFGKSLIIRIASLYYSFIFSKKVYICVPTIALMNEYNDEIKKINNTNLTISSSMNWSANIYVLTQERMLDICFSKNELLIVDEAYYLNENNSRSAILNSVVNKAIKNNVYVKLVMPSIVGNSVTNYLNKNTLFKEMILFNSFCSRNIEGMDIENTNDSIYDIVSESRSDNSKIAIFSYLENHNNICSMFRNINIKEKIENKLWYKILIEIYSNNFLYIKYLESGIVINNGNIPVFFRYITEKVFKNQNEINIIVCNTTLSKGVNLGIQKLIINAIGYKKTEFDEFEIKNLLGRVGRITNNVLDRVGDVYPIFEEEKYKSNFQKILELNKTKKVDYKPNNSKKEIKKFNENIHEIENGDFDITKYFIDKDKNKFHEILNENLDKFEPYYALMFSNNKSNKCDYDSFYRFIVNDIFSGIDNLVKHMYPWDNAKEFESKLKFREIMLFKYIFPAIFTNIKISEISEARINYLIKNDYYYNIEIISKRSLVEFGKSRKKFPYRMKELNKNSDDYVYVYTEIYTEITQMVSKFYDALFQMIETEIINYLRIIHSNDDWNFDKVDEIDKFLISNNLPNELRSILKNIKNENKREEYKNQILKALKEIEDINEKIIIDK